MSSLPSGTLTFLFTDVKGSTVLIQDEVHEGRQTLITTQEIVRDALVRAGGHEVHCAGDGFFFVFPHAPDAVKGALRVQEKLIGSPVQVRIGMHTGHADMWNAEYLGIDVHRAARIAAAAHGGQVLMSRSTRELVTCDVTDLGPHRLRDIRDSIHLYQAGSTSFPPIASQGRSNLPTPSTSFVGRARELAALNRILDTEGARLLTLTGPGGIGKTRLAAEFARRRASSHPDGAWWVDLGSVMQPQLVPEVISKAIGGQGDLSQFVGHKRCLLVLDNFEYVQTAGSFVADLIGHCPNLVVVATSRSPLRVTSEWLFSVEPLLEPDAIALFCARALAVGIVVRKSKPIAAICRRVEHVPLALELAAAKAVVLTPPDLLKLLEDRLYSLSAASNDVPDRHRTLRATVQWSYELLDDEERVMFARLAIFAGGWSHEIAHAVFGVDMAVVESLVAKSFIRVVNGRMGMLEIIREFGLEQLEATPQRATEARGRHRDYFLALVERENQIQSTGSSNWGASFHALEAERQNIRAALVFSLQSPDSHVLALRFCVALHLYWTRWHRQEGLQACLSVLARRRPDWDVRLTAGTSWTAASLSIYVGNAKQASLLYEEASTLLKNQGLPTAEAMVISDLGHLAYLTGDFGTARNRFSQLMSIALALRDEKLTANAHFGMARVALTQGDHDEARAHLEPALAGYVEVGHRSNQALALLYRGLLSLDEDDRIAEGDLRKALSLSRESGEVMIECSILRCLGTLEARRENLAAARVLLRDSLLLNAHSDDFLELAQGLRSAAVLCFRDGAMDRGAMLIGAVSRAGAGFEALLEALLSPNDRAQIAAARFALGTDFEGLQQEGASMSVSESIEIAIRILGRKSPARTRISNLKVAVSGQRDDRPAAGRSS